MWEMITSPSNALVKYVKALHKKKGRTKNNSFFVEGIKIVEECISSGGEIQHILYSDSLFESNGGEALFNQLSEDNHEMHYVDDNILRDISDTENPQGIIAVVQLLNSKLEDIILPKNNFIIYLDRVQDPGNVGTIIRTADALGATGIIVTSGTVDVFNPKVVRSTMGSIFHLPIAYSSEGMDALLGLRKKNIKIISTSLKGNIPCSRINFNDDFVLVIGNEASGVDDDILNISDYLTKIPMAGRAESLNVAIATGILMYEASRQRLNF